MIVLSCFDGMSCGQQAIERLGVPVAKYFAYEIDKYAVQITSKNYPETIHLGNICDWPLHNLPKIDLILAGSPCQGFSFAGKQLNFDDPRSKLFFEFVKLWKALKAVNPDIKFLLENVKMKQESLDVITQHMGVEPILINSALVSAQNRQRWYWTDLPSAGQPDDKCIFLKDVMHEYRDAGIDAEHLKVCRKGRYKKHQNKASCLTGGHRGDGNHSDMDVIAFLKCSEVGHALDINGHDFLKRIYSKYGKAPTLTAICGGNQHRKVAIDDYVYRRLSVVEWERLQTVKDGYTDGVSQTQAFKMLGNGWTVDVIAHILKSLK